MHATACRTRAIRECYSVRVNAIWAPCDVKVL